MGRSRLPLELIQKEKSRKITFQKRTMGLKKKTYEISTLCGVDACVIIYSCSSDDRPSEPIFWPSDPEDVKSIITRYKEHSKEERGLKTLDLSGFFEERTKKIQKEISKLGHHGGDPTKYPAWDERLNDLSIDQLKDLMKSWRAKLELVQSRAELMKMNQAILEGPVMVNPNYPNTAMATAAAAASTQGLHIPYLSAMDSSMSLLPNPMPQPLMNPRMSKMMMMMNDGAGGSPHYGGPSNCNTYAPPLQFYYDPSPGMLENIVYSNPGPSSSCYYPQVSIGPSMLPYIQNQMVPNLQQMNRDYDGNDIKQCIRFG